MSVANLIPDQMEVRPLASVAEVMVSNVDKLSHDGEMPVRLCNYTDAYKNEEVHPGLELMEATATRAEIARFRLAVGDTVFTKDSESADDIGVPAFVTATADDFVCGYHLAIARPDPRRIDPKYLYWWLASREAAEQWENRAAGVTRVGLRQPDIRSFPLTVHRDLSDQRLIADFLDRETAQVDAMIEAQRELVAALEERRAAAIGDLTGHHVSRWPMGVVKHLGKVTLGKMLASAETSSASIEAGYLRAANVQPHGVLDLADIKTMWFTPSEARSLTLIRGDVVVVEGGQGGFGRAAFIQRDLPGIAFQNSINRVRPDASGDGRFIAYSLIHARSTGFMHAYCDVVSMPHLTAEKLSNFPIRMPPFDEQQRIADELDAATSRIDAMTEAANESIALMQERRSALISAAVTGRIDPRTGREYSQEAS